jgi:hypothetical protein
MCAWSIWSRVERKSARYDTNNVWAVFYYKIWWDCEEHKRQSRSLAFQLQNTRDERAGIAFYEIPPTPKPFTGKFLPASRYSPLPGISGTRDLDLRSSSKADEHYIAFPPSGLPVYGNVEVMKTNTTYCVTLIYSRSHSSCIRSQRNI